MTDASPVSAAPLLTARGIVLEYGEGPRRVRAIDGLDLDVAHGEFVGLVGPSGSGKSSLLFVLAGLRLPTSGSVSLGGTLLSVRAEANASTRRQRIGFLAKQKISPKRLFDASQMSPPVRLRCEPS